MELEGKTAIVTGSGRGIGRAIALEFARQGANVVCCARRENEVAETVGMIEAEGGAALSVRCDVADKGEVDNLVEKAVERFGGVDVLFNNAASFRSLGAVWEVDPDEWWGDVTTNVLGPMLCARAVLPHMMKRNEGVIINMYGGGAVVPLPGGSGYGCSKAALLRLTDTLAGELEREGYSIYVVSIGPGFVRTETTEYQCTNPLGVKWIPSSKEAIEAGETRPPEDCARSAVWMLRVLCPEMNGRIFDTGMDFDDVARRAGEMKEKALRLLRLNK
ncbi:MAG: SDR family NAD(P)-dependent oxidoreductase [Planctomycetota bacterium]|jgi:NAD(P)-dependent dehydrogenase (short-subunit alcohol dehydrogenase family)